jgi:hypothetical protein
VASPRLTWLAWGRSAHASMAMQKMHWLGDKVQKSVRECSDGKSLATKYFQDFEGLIASGSMNFVL